MLNITLNHFNPHFQNNANLQILFNLGSNEHTKLWAFALCLIEEALVQGQAIFCCSERNIHTIFELNQIKKKQ